jgi:hypothetical protein
MNSRKSAFSEARTATTVRRHLLGPVRSHGRHHRGHADMGVKRAADRHRLPFGH